MKVLWKLLAGKGESLSQFRKSFKEAEGGEEIDLEGVIREEGIIE